MSQILYFQITTTATYTNGLYPGYPNNTPYTINGQPVSVDHTLSPLVWDDPLGAYLQDPQAWTGIAGGIYVQDYPINTHYWTRTYVFGSATFSRPSDYNTAPFQNGDYKYMVAIVPDSF